MSSAGRVAERPEEKLAIADTVRELLATADLASPASSQVARQLDTIVNSSYASYRELLLMIIATRIHFRDYMPSQDLYACSPRTLYPKYIRQVVKSEFHIPGKKDPALNIAKAEKRLDDSWVSGTKDPAAGRELQRLTQTLEGMNRDELTELGRQLAVRLLDLAERVADMSVEISPLEDAETVAEALTRLIHDAPDRGNTAQTIVGLLMQSLVEATGSSASVAGLEDPACVTTTTGKKLGDLALLVDQYVVEAWEVTTKPFDTQRIEDSTQSVHDYNAEYETDVTEVGVLCLRENLPSEMPSAGVGATSYFGRLDHEDVTYRFFNLEGWVLETVCRLPQGHRRTVVERVNDYVNDLDTDVSVKTAWANTVKVLGMG